eukprot:TRINITY_DN2995_c0_g1_i2.p1 TRINITY_DN2995_c0_g1~~TRINITY_DN2995_c0_g1_i2.p1  ORF type:complete len:1358 (-),score=306.87 TRINITY_DN2995_c0_g1_i2:93-4166(-)
MEEILLNTDGCIKGACMAKLMEHITLPGEEQFADRSRLTKDILFMHRNFSTHSELFDALMNRFLTSAEANTNNMTPIQQRVIDTLQQWVALHPDDWATDSKLRNKARAFLDTNPTYSAQFDPLAQQVSQTKRQFVRLYNAWEIERTPVFDANKTDLLSWEPTDLAKEMFLFDASLFIEVHRTDFLGLLNKSEDVEYFTRFESMGKRRIDWVASELYKQDLDKIARKLKAIVMLVEACLEYNNLFAASYILLGLQGESVTKLSACWEQGPLKILTCAKTLNDKVKQLQTIDNRNTVYIPHLEVLREQMQKSSKDIDSMPPNVINVQWVRRFSEILTPIYNAAQTLLKSTPPFQYNLAARYFLTNLRVIENRSQEEGAGAEADQQAENTNQNSDDSKRKRPWALRRKVYTGRLGRLFGRGSSTNVTNHEVSSRLAISDEFDPIDLRSSASFVTLEKQLEDIEDIISTKSQKADDANLRLVKFKELLKTESNYVYCLAYYVNNNLNELKLNKICSQKKIDILTGNIEHILHFHRSFLNALKTGFLKWNDKTTEVGAIFLKYHRYFHIYIDFVINFDLASEVLEKLKVKNTLFAELDERLKNEDDSQNLDFASILIRPVQRIPRYIMLLEEILKGTNSTHVDYNKLKEALRKMKCTADRINTAKKQKQQKQRAIQLDKLISGVPASMSLASDQRNLVAEHKLLLVKDKDILPVTLLIFSDCLLIAKDISTSRMEFLALFDVLHSKFRKSTAEDVKKNHQVSVPDRDFFLEIHHKKRVYILAVESRIKQKDIAFEFNYVTKQHHSRYWRTLDLEPTTPKPRVGHSSAIIGDKVYLFGGFDTHKTYFNGLHMLDVVSGVWEEIKPQEGFVPPHMAYHSCSVVEDKLYVFGGTAAGEKYFNHFFEVTVSDLDFTAHWTPIVLKGEAPEPRAYHSATVVDDKIYIFGGMTTNGLYSTYFDDMYLIDPVTRTSEKVDIVKTTIVSEERTPRGSSETTRSISSSDDTVRSRSSLDSVRPSSSESRDDSTTSRSSLDGSRASLVNQRSSEKLTLGTARKRSSTVTLPEISEVKKKDRKKLEKEAKKQDKKKAAVAAVPLVHVTTAPNNISSQLSPRKDSHPTKRQKALSLTRKPNHPSARALHASVAMGHEIYFFGGKNQDSNSLKDMFVFDTETKLFRRIRRATGFVPMARYGATAHNLTNETFLLFGGANAEHTFSEYFVFNKVKNQWHKGVVNNCPLPPRHCHTSHVVGSSLWIFDGCVTREGQTEATDDVLILNNIFEHLEDPEVYLKTRNEPKVCRLISEHYSGIKKYRYKLLKPSEPHSDDSYVFKTMNKENQELLLIIDDQQTEIELLKLKNVELEKKHID